MFKYEKENFGWFVLLGFFCVAIAVVTSFITHIVLTHFNQFLHLISAVLAVLVVSVFAAGALFLIGWAVDSLSAVVLAIVKSIHNARK